jgi:hypothetical protein
MKNVDCWSSLFWLLLSSFACVEALRLGIGTPRRPGTGFMAFGTSVLLGILSLTLFVKSLVKKKETKIQPLSSGTMWNKTLLVLIALIIYATWMPAIGYLLSTFLFMSLLFWLVERQKLWRIVILAFLTSLISYYVFSKLLNCQFPEGLIGF